MAFLHLLAVLNFMCLLHPFVFAQANGTNSTGTNATSPFDFYLVRCDDSLLSGRPTYNFTAVAFYDVQQPISYPLRWPMPNGWPIMEGVDSVPAKRWEGRVSKVLLYSRQLRGWATVNITEEARNRKTGTYAGTLEFGNETYVCERLYGLGEYYGSGDCTGKYCTPEISCSVRYRCHQGDIPPDDVECTPANSHMERYCYPYWSWDPD